MTGKFAPHEKEVLEEARNQFHLFKWILNTHHKYMKYKDVCGRRLNYLIYYRKELAGIFGLCGGFMGVGAINKYIGWTQAQQKKNIVHVLNNYRFAMIKEGLPTSQLLSILKKVAVPRWTEKYGSEPVLMESLVKPPFKGTVYKAAGWEYIGMTKGTSFHTMPVSIWSRGTGKRAELAKTDMQQAIKEHGYLKNGKTVETAPTEPKLIYVLPLTRNWKEILCN